MGGAVTAPAAAPARPGRARLRAALLPALPLARVRALRTLLYAVVILDVLTFSRDVLSHTGNAAFYTPVALARVLHLPPVTMPLAVTLLALILAGCAAGIAGHRPRLAGTVVALAYWPWMLYSNSYGYVAHDHMALMVAVAVLPTVAGASRRELAAARADAQTADAVGTGTAQADATKDDTAQADRPVGAPAHPPSSEAAGWALRCVQLAVVATYFFSVIPKILYSGSLAAWGNSAILTWASIRRGSALAHWLVAHMPWVFVPAQWAGLALEALSPVVLFLRGRALYVAVGLYLCFHLSTLVLLGIHFLPTAVCWAAFLPLERLRRRRGGRCLTARPCPPSPVRGRRSSRPSPRG